LSQGIDCDVALERISLRVSIRGLEINLQLVNGGEGPTFVLLSARKNWADFAPLPKTLADVLNDTFGKETADQIQKTVRDCTAHQFTEAAAYRADLSYVPGK